MTLRDEARELARTARRLRHRGITLCVERGKRYAEVTAWTKGGASWTWSIADDRGPSAWWRVSVRNASEHAPGSVAALSRRNWRGPEPERRRRILDRRRNAEILHNTGKSERPRLPA